jgi:hypothetical protein
MPNPPRRYEWPQLTAIIGRSFGFKESAFVTDPGEAEIDQFCSYPSRQIRYAVLWSQYEGNVYRRIRKTAGRLKSEYGLYEYIRSILNPTYELVQFYVNTVMGGMLDPEAGDGKARPSAVPIEVPDTNPRADDLRRAIAVLWDEQHSNWQIAKDTYVRFGAALGDVFLYVEDDERRQRVRVRPMHPRAFEKVDLDPYGNVRGYVIREWRPDPRYPDSYQEALYTERCERVGQSVHYATSIGTDEEPWDWSYDPDGLRPEWRPDWTEEYGFVPVFKVQHNDVGIGWGFAAVFPALSLVYEIDDLMSKLNDQIRKVVSNPRMLTGTSPPGTTAADGAIADDALSGSITYATAADYREDPEAARGDLDILYNPNDKADVKSFLGDLDIAAASEHIQYIRKAIERKLPELADDRGTSAGDASGRALLVYRQAKEILVRACRANYFAGLVRAQMAAIHIGAAKEYPGFEDFDEGSYDRGELDHRIGDGPVFQATDADKLALALSKAQALKTMIEGGMPFVQALKELGYPDEQIDEIMRLKAVDEAKATRQRRASQAALFGPADAEMPADDSGSGLPPPAGAGDNNSMAVPIGNGADGRFRGA